MLLADAILSTAAGNYAYVTGALTGHESSHLNYESGLPDGANLAFTDGHAEWRKFSEVKLRYRVSAGGPYFYW